MPSARSQVVRSNRRQVLLFAALTLILTIVTVWGGRIWLRNSETLVFAVGDANGAEARFAARLAAVLKNNISRLRLKIVSNADNAKALAQFDRTAGRSGGAAHRRQGPAARPRARDPRARRAAADQPRRQEDQVACRSEEKEDRRAGRRRQQRAFVRNILDIADSPTPPRGSRRRRRIRRSTSCSRRAAMARSIAIAHASTIMKDKSYEQYAKRGGFTLNAIDEAKALARRNPGISEETLATGMLSSSPAIPDDDLDTIGLQWLLVAQSRMSTTTAGDLARIDLRKQGRTRAGRRLRLQDRAGGHRQGRLRRRAPGRRRIYQRRHQVVHGPLQRPDVSRRRRAQRHRFDLCRRSTPRSPGSRRRRPANSPPPFSISASGSSTPIRWTRSRRCRTNSRPSCAAR